MNASVLVWFKSSHSGTQGDDCVEIAVTERAVHVRDSKSVSGPQLIVSPGDWARFVRSTARG
ncbi:DUF397 domain-containing protein [Yinghuangia sp. YIM S09857]|uniref:DUF397 domain-containing protein n=1 Tax=Yinghuangia sp. YIM S09857 TaxID=3436929 RepID=UPI003F53C584